MVYSDGELSGRSNTCPCHSPGKYCPMNLLFKAAEPTFGSTFLHSRPLIVYSDREQSGSFTQPQIGSMLCSCHSPVTYKSLLSYEPFIQSCWTYIRLHLPSFDSTFLHSRPLNLPSFLYARCCVFLLPRFPTARVRRWWSVTMSLRELWR